MKYPLPKPDGALPSATDIKISESGTIKRLPPLAPTNFPVSLNSIPEEVSVLAKDDKTWKSQGLSANQCLNITSPAPAITQ